MSYQLHLIQYRIGNSLQVRKVIIQAESSLNAWVIFHASSKEKVLLVSAAEIDLPELVTFANYSFSNNPADTY